MDTKKHKVMYVRNVVFGIEDSLVSTVGLLSGIAVSDVSTATIILTGVVLIFVESISMAAGSLISEHQASEYESRKDLPLGKARFAALLMFVSYLLAGLVPLWPYFLFSHPTALWTSIGTTLVCLFLLGAVSAIRFGVRPLYEGFRTLLIGGVAILVGVLVGKLLEYFGVIAHP